MADVVDPGVVGAVQGGFVSEGWHYVNGAGEPAFNSNWGSAGSASFRIREAGIVDISIGVIASPDLATNKIWTMPEGYRPTNSMDGGVVGYGTRTGGSAREPIYVAVDPDGSVFAYAMDGSGVILVNAYVGGQFFIDNP